MPSTNPNQIPPQEEPQGQPEAKPEVDLDELEAKLKILRAQEQELLEAREAVAPPDPEQSTPLPGDGRLASEVTEAEVARAQILRDPYDSKNALKILCDPPGRKLRWLSTTYRDMRTMKGWRPVSFEDPIGREIERYIGVPPARMEGSSQADSIIRRGDVFLAWIDVGIWAKRQQARTDEAARRMATHTTPSQTQLGQHAATTGDGLTRDGNPYQYVKKAPGFVDPSEQAYRKNARGTVGDPAQRVQGQNMFEEVPEQE